MAMIRRVALGLLLAAAAIALALAMIQFSRYSPGDYPPAHASSDLNEQARMLEERVVVLSRRVGDMELLVLVLLVTSGLYALVFVASSYFSAKSFARQADRTVNHIKEEIGVAMGDLRELQEQPQGGLANPDMTRGTEEHGASVNEGLATGTSIPEVWESQVAAMAQRTTHWKTKNLTDHEKLELLRYESEAAYLEIAGGQRLATAVASLYRNFSWIYAANEPVRARFYLDRALVLAFPEPQLASEVRYDLACWFAGAHDFEQAMRELAAAFQRQSTALDARLATDLEEGGRLFELASTPPFDKRLNDLLLNVSIP
jgi:hypothetical protein